MRGKVEVFAYDWLVVRITPACAGKSKRFCCMAFLCLGSPPRVRGKGDTFDVSTAAIRITPACAGKRGTLDFWHYADKDHPRVCGEKAVAFIAWYSWMGSPPRVRGKALLAQRWYCVVGITPACAGKRTGPGGRHRTPWDHPRVCGEKTEKIP